VSDVEWSSDLQARIDAVRADLLKKFGDAVAKDAVRLAPVDTGLLKSRITANEDGSRVTADTEYAAPVEFGHRVVVDGKDTGKRVPAQPYLRPAAYRVRDLS
jgi:hypothetical protein